MKVVGTRKKEAKFPDSKHISDDDYNKLCYDVTKRIYTNQLKEEKQYNQLFSQTIDSNQFDISSPLS
jgi:hypothetical protein